MITLDMLEKLAHSVVNQPWGCGDKQLAANPESWAPYLRFLNGVAAMRNPDAIVECGVYMATATIHMAVGSPTTFVVGVDRQFHAAAADNVFHYPNIWLVEGDTVEAAPNVGGLLAGRKIGLLFLDSTHDGDTPRREFEAYQPMFAKECVVACDDLRGPRHLWEKMDKFWQRLPAEKLELHFLHPRLNTSYDEPGFGVAIVRK